MLEYRIQVKIDIKNNLKKTELYAMRAIDVAFQAGKGCCGCALQKLPDLDFFVFGKFSDIVRVYSALKNNNFKPIMIRGENNAV